MSSHPVTNLVIPGFPKSGTTSLFQMLATHPVIDGARIKEPHIYSIDERYKKRFDQDYKRSLPRIYLNDSPVIKYRLEASTTYMISPVAIERLHADSPDSLFIVSMRDPIERVISHYKWLLALGLVDGPFRNEISLANKIKFSPTIHSAGNYKNYLEFSAYGSQIERLFTSVDRTKVLFFSSEELKNNQEIVMDSVCQFLAIERINFAQIYSNKSGKAEATICRTERKNIFSKMVKNILGFNKNNLITSNYSDISFEDKVWVYQQLESEIKKMEMLGIKQASWETVKAIETAMSR